MRRRIGLILLAAAAISLASVPGGAGAAIKVRSKITIGLSGTTLKGKVKSRKAVCRKHRKVLVHRGSKVVAKTKTNRRGKWRASIGHHPGRYYAVAKTKRTHSLVCKRAKSRTITVSSGGGGGKTLSTNLTIRFTPPGPYSSNGGTFSGTVGSPASSCISGRTVSVYPQGSTKAIGTGTSKASGAWAVQAPTTLQPGNYFAKAPSTDVNAGTCEAGTSPTISVP
jgi:hypothetical protein